MAVKELKELVAFGLSAGELVAGLLDGVGFDDVAKVVKTGVLAAAAIPVAHDALLEYANMTDAEAEDLESYVVTNFNIDNADVEKAIESALTLLIKLHDLAKLLVH